MGRYINYYAVKDDFKELMNFAYHKGLVAIPEIVETLKYDLAELSVCDTLHFWPDQSNPIFYLVPGNIPLVEVFYKPMKLNPENSLLISHVSPVIECAPCLLNENELYHSRLYIDAPRDDPWSNDVYRAYNALTGYIRKWPKVEKQTHAGPETYNLVKDGILHLMVLGRELDIE